MSHSHQIDQANFPRHTSLGDLIYGERDETQLHVFRRMYRTLVRVGVYHYEPHPDAISQPDG